MEEVNSFARERFSMIEHQLRGQGITDERVLQVMGRVPRHRFLPQQQWDEAYAPRAVPIEEGQTLSQPFIVATMTQALSLAGGEKVLEIGTGSGYQATVLAMLGARVYSVERHASLAQRARQVLDELGISGIELSVGDGSTGWPKEAPFDAILVTAAAPSLPEELLAQLADPGRLVAPVGGRHLQTLLIVRRENGEDHIAEGCACRFVPLLGEGGFAGEG